jgi:transposase
MRQVREVLRLRHACGQSERQIATAIGISRTTVAEYLRRATVSGITWPVPAGLDDAALEARLFSPPFTPREALRPQPDWPRIHAELRRPGVTLMLLWQEYRAEQPEGYGYSRFCDLHADWRGGVSPTMRQTHLAGDKLFVDFAGQTLAVIDPATGEVRPAQVFVAVLGASSLTYAEVRWSQGLADWVGCHVNAFAFFGGAARQLVCDNLKAGVTAACRYEPGINRTYQEMAAHYGAAVVPTRVGVLVGGVVVDDGVNRLTGRHRGLDLVEEADKLLMPVALHVAADHRAVQHVQRGEQGGGAVADVVVGHRPGSALLHRQAWLGAVERLDLALFVDRQHDGMGGGIDVEAHDIAEFLGKLRVVGELERLHPVRRQAVGLPDALNADGADAGRLGHRADAPVRGFVGRVGERQVDHALDNVSG